MRSMLREGQPDDVSQLPGFETSCWAHGFRGSPWYALLAISLSRFSKSGADGGFGVQARGFRTFGWWKPHSGCSISSSSALKSDQFWANLVCHQASMTSRPVVSTVKFHTRGQRGCWRIAGAIWLGRCQLCGHWCSSMGSRKAFAGGAGCTHGRQDTAQVAQPFWPLCAFALLLLYLALLQAAAILL